MPIRTRPIATVQRRSRPVNGSDFAVAGAVLVAGVVVVVAGAVVVVGVLLSFDGDVPVVGVDAGVVLVGVVLVVGGGGVWL
jgi:hypothetical protein